MLPPSPQPENFDSVLNRLLHIKSRWEPQGGIDSETLAADYERGLRQRLQEEQSPLLEEALQHYLDSVRTELSARSISEYTSYFRRISRQAPQLAGLHVAAYRKEHCAELLHTVYPTAAGRNKARRLLHAFFEYACDREWTEYNPMARLKAETAEKAAPRIPSADQINTLLQLALQPRYRSIAAALGFLLWGKKRLSEIAMLRWEHIKRETLPAPLQHWLSLLPNQEHGRILPPDWRQQWHELRREAGWEAYNAGSLRAYTPTAEPLNETDE